MNNSSSVYVTLEGSLFKMSRKSYREYMKLVAYDRSDLALTYFHENATHLSDALMRLDNVTKEQALLKYENAVNHKKYD